MFALSLTRPYRTGAFEIKPAVFYGKIYLIYILPLYPCDKQHVIFPLKVDDPACLVIFEPTQQILLAGKIIYIPGRIFFQMRYNFILFHVKPIFYFFCRTVNYKISPPPFPSPVKGEGILE